MRRMQVFPGLTACELMRPTLVLPHEMGVAKAAALLRNGQVGTACVTDAEGRCVGTLSSQDVLQWAAVVTVTEMRKRKSNEGVWCDWQIVAGSAKRGHEVGAYMTRDPVLVTRRMRLVDFAEALFEESGPTVVVVDADRCPLGLVLPADVLKAIAVASYTPRAPQSGIGSQERKGAMERRGHAPARV